MSTPDTPPAETLISVLTVTLNSERTLGRTIESFLSQGHPKKEMLVIDGDSKDGTVALAESFLSPQIKVFSEPDLGMYDALNKGLKLYAGDAFGVLNSNDCFAHSSVLSKIAEGLSLNDMVHGDLCFVDPNRNRRVVRQWRSQEKPPLGFRAGWMPPHPTFYVKRSVAESVGEFDLRLKTAADYDWMLRAVELFSFGLGRIDSTIVEMEVGGRSTSSVASHVIHNLEALRSRQRWLKSGVVDIALFLKVMRKLTQVKLR